MTTAAGLVSKKVTAQAYEALAEALAAICWNKAPFERHVRMALHEHPELLARLDFTQVKRSVAGAVVQLLAEDSRYHQTTLQMMTELAEMTVFPNLASQPDADQLTARARNAIEALRKITEQYRADLDGQERVQAQHRAAQLQQAAQRRLDEALAEVKAGFVMSAQAASLNAADGSSNRCSTDCWTCTTCSRGSLTTCPSSRSTAPSRSIPTTSS